MDSCDKEAITMFKEAEHSVRMIETATNFLKEDEKNKNTLGRQEICRQLIRFETLVADLTELLEKSEKKI